MASGRRAKHHCHARDCTRACPPRFLMCGMHWAMVPPALQDAVYAAFNPRQCQPGQERPAPTGAWMVAADAAILAVWLLERRVDNAETVARVTYNTMRLAAVYAHDMEEDWRALLTETLHVVPATLPELRVALQKLLAPRPPRRMKQAS